MDREVGGDGERVRLGRWGVLVREKKMLEEDCGHGSQRCQPGEICRDAEDEAARNGCVPYPTCTEPLAINTTTPIRANYRGNDSNLTLPVGAFAGSM